MTENKPSLRVEEISSWYQELIEKLDGPLSKLVARGDFSPDSLDGVIHKWATENGSEAMRLLWTFDCSQYLHPDLFGFLVADLTEDGRDQDVEAFRQALLRERDRT